MELFGWSPFRPYTLKCISFLHKKPLSRNVGHVQYELLSPFHIIINKYCFWGTGIHLNQKSYCICDLSLKLL